MQGTVLLYSVYMNPDCGNIVPWVFLLSDKMSRNDLFFVCVSKLKVTVNPA